MLPLLITAVTGFVSVRLFLHYFSVDMYALWLYVTAFSGMFGFADLGLGVAVGRYVGMALGKNDLDAVRGYWGTGNLIIIPFLASVTVVFMVLGVWLGPKWYNVSPDHANLLRVCLVASGFEVFFGYYSQYWSILTGAHLDYRFIGIWRATTSLLRIIPMIALAYLTNNPFLVISWGALMTLLELSVFVWRGRRNYNLGLDFRAASFACAREMSAYIV